jgi:hypothetical protein
MFTKICDFLKRMDWIDWLLAVGFIGAFTWVGISLIDFPLWLAFPVAGAVLIVLAKNRRDRTREEDDDSPRSENH